MSASHGKHEGVTGEEKCTALESAFRRLHIQRFEQAMGIPYEILIPGIGRQLLLMCPGSPRPKVAAFKKALHNLAQSTGRAIEVLDCLRQTALVALNYWQVEIW